MEVETKRCSKCKEEWPLTMYESNGIKGGKRVFRSDCKRCRSAYRKSRGDKFKESSRRWREKNRERFNRHMVRSYKRNKFMHEAAGKITQANLRREGLHAHHWSYLLDNQLDIIYLFPKDHRNLHSYLELDRERLCFRHRFTGEVYDTFEKHLAFIESLNLPYELP